MVDGVVFGQMPEPARSFKGKVNENKRQNVRIRLKSRFSFFNLRTISSNFRNLSISVFAMYN